jgi:hypothetical protein
MAAIDRSIVITRAKHIITHGISLLRDSGVSSEEIAAIVFAGAMAAGSSNTQMASTTPSSSASSVVGDIAAEPKKRGPGRPKKERDPDAPKRQGNAAALAESNGRAKKWYEDEYKPTWESKKDEWRELYNSIPVKKDAKRERQPFPEDKPIAIQMALSIFKKLNPPTAEQLAAKKAAAKKTKEVKKSDVPTVAADAPATVSASEQEDDMYSLELDGQNYVYNELNQTWFLNEDGTKGAWAGIYDPANNTLDDTAEEPAA